MMWRPIHHESLLLLLVGWFLVQVLLFLQWKDCYLKIKNSIWFYLFPKRLNNLKDGKLKETFSSEELRTIISPEVESNSYYMRTGEHGIGQIFWLQQLAGADNLGHGGIVYLKVSSFWRPKRIWGVIGSEIVPIPLDRWQNLLLYFLVHGNDCCFGLSSLWWW